MSMTLGSTTVQKNVNTSFNTPYTGLKAIIITNLSGLTCRITMQGGNVSKTLNPGISDWFDVRSGYNGTILINPLTVILNPASYAGNTITFDAIGASDSEQNTMYPIQLTLPAVTATASGKPIFTSGVRFDATATVEQTLNLFNPPTSNVNLTIHSAIFYTTDTAATNRCSLVFSAGADLNLTTNNPPISHIAGPASAIPTSVVHSTFNDNAAGPTGNIMEFRYTPTKTQVDFLVFPDLVIVQPGTNLFMVMHDSAAPQTVLLLFKWTEDQIV